MLQGRTAGFPQKTWWPGLRRGGIGGYNLHSPPPPDCGTPTTCRLYPFGRSVCPSQIAGQPSRDGGRLGRSGNLGYQYVMIHCIKGSCQVYGHTHCTVRWFPLVETCLDVCCELESGRSSRVFGSEAVLTKDDFVSLGLIVFLQKVCSFSLLVGVAV